MHKLLISILSIAFVAACAPTTVAPEADLVVISVLGTNDVHGELIRQPGRGGMTTFSGYVAAVRDARAADGAVLLVDAGDMWQGTLESNLSEGSVAVEAYNALGYAASAVGNHEFDFGPVGPKSIPEAEGDDPQGALRQRATELNFPLLAANLIDESTGKIVAWDNFRASTMASLAGISIGIIGVLTESTPETTIAANTAGVRIAPLAKSIIPEARALRTAGAALIIVVAHAGSSCQEFDNPYDLSSCNLSGEVMRVAQEIPEGLVDHIVGGHEHRGIAHIVNGIAITASYSNARAFGRVDFTLDRNTGAVVDRQVFPPQYICTRTPDESGRCAFEDDEMRAAASYAGRPVIPMAEVSAIAERARETAARRKAEKLGVYLETPMTLRTRPESVLGNLMTDAVLESNDADISIHNVYGGIRAELPQGDLTFGSVFQMFPFDNRIAVVEMEGLDVRRIIATQAHSENRPAGFSGMRVFVGCDAGKMSVRMLTTDGREIGDADKLKVVVNDFLLMGGDDILTPVIPEGGFEIPRNTPLVRDTLVDWFSGRGGRLSADEFFDSDKPRWNRPDPMPAECSFSSD
jgi:5'-nucleotidase